MQDRYVGDVGDFGKYGLLRWLCREDKHGSELRLGVLWYRFDRTDNSNDGGHTQYICNPSRTELHLRQCDTELYGEMEWMVKSNKRSIAAVEASRALPADTLFFNGVLSFGQAASKDEERRNWITAGLRAVEEADVVFADPDNGLEVPSYGPLSMEGLKYVYYGDLRPIWERGQSIVVYHHLGRRAPGHQGGSAELQIMTRGGELRRELHRAEPIALRFRRRSGRVYFVLPQPRHAERLKARIDTFLASPWGHCNPPHFQRECLEAPDR